MHPDVSARTVKDEGLHAEEEEAWLAQRVYGVGGVTARFTSISGLSVPKRNFKEHLHHDQSANTATANGPNHSETKILRRRRESGGTTFRI